MYKCNLACRCVSEEASIQQELCHRDLDFMLHRLISVTILLIVHEVDFANFVISDLYLHLISGVIHLVI